MKTEEFSRALNEIDDKYIEEARCYKMKKRFPIKQTIAAAACVALMIGTIPLVKHFNTPAGTGTTGGVVQGTTGGEDALPTVIKLGESGKFTAYDTGEHDAVLQLNANRKEEFKIEKFANHFVDPTKEKTRKTITLNGKTWTGQYSQSVDSAFYGYDYDIYIGVDLLTWKNIFSIRCNSDTGEVIGFYAEPVCLSEISKTPISRDESYEKAVEFLKKNVIDINEYVLHQEKANDIRSGYDFSFRRVVNGVKTDDHIEIGITGAGEIYTYHLYGYKSMGNVDLSALNMTSLNQTIDAKINTIYKNNFDITSNSEITLRRLEDGTYYFYCITRVNGRTTKDGELLQDLSVLAITMD